MAGVRPSGTVTFLFTDIEGSTRLWEQSPDAMKEALARHDEIVRGAIEGQDGYIFATGGDSFAAAFHTADDALQAALEAQRDLTAGPTGGGLTLRVRMGIHTGVADERDGDYFGPTLNTSARLAASVAGAQLAISGATRLLLPAVAVTEAGAHVLPGLGRPLDIHLVVAEGLDSMRQPRGPAANGDGTAIIGREGETAEIGDLLADYPLVTLIGPGGVGKTTLASEAASQLGDRFAGGVYIAELAGTSDDEDVAGLVARQVDADSLDALRLRSSATPTLVVLDNCESALVQSRSIAAELTDGHTEIRVLATSRSPLYATGERLMTVKPLAVPDDQLADGGDPAPSVRLFLRRAEEAGANWPHDERNLAAINRLTKQLNGLPLAIELAAARSRLLAPSELEELLDSQLDLLVKPGHATSRHHSLRSVIETSYAPLSTNQQRFLRCLAVMSAPFDLELAHRVAGDTESRLDSLDRLARLVDASLVDVREGPDGRAQYLLLDSIRAFGREKLDETGETAATSERYADAVAGVAAQFVVDALDSFTPELLARIRAKFSHLIYAISWCLDHDPSPARSYQMFLPFYGPSGATEEIAELARQVRQTWDESAPFQAEAWAVMGTSTFLSGHYRAGADLAAEAIAHPDATELAEMMGNRTLGYMAALDGDIDRAKAHLDTAVDVAEPFSAAFTRELQISRCAVVTDPAESPAALEMLADVRRRSAADDEWIMVVWSAVTSAYHHMLLDDVASAQRTSEEALAVADGSGLSWAVSTAHRYVASIRAVSEGWEAAAPHFREALEATLSVGDIDGIAMAMRAAAGAARHGGRHELASELWATIPSRPGLPIPPSIFHELEQELQAELGPPMPVESDALVRTARRLLGPKAAEAEPAGTEPPPEPAVEYEPIVRFGEYELDLAMCELRHHGERVPMEPQVYDVLAYLVMRRGTMVSKNEVLDEVWGDRFVSESALSSRIAAARRATGDDGKAQRVIRTVHGKGFTFVAEVE